MSKLKPLWVVTMISPEPGILAPPSPVEIQADFCNAQDDGTLLFRDEIGHELAIIAVIAAGQWLMAKRQVDSKSAWPP